MTTLKSDNTVVILYSGGLDSYILYEYAKSYGYDVTAVYYRHGAESEEAEIAALPDFVEVKTIEWLNDKVKAVAKASDPFAGPIYIPGRNLVFTTLAACQYLPDEIWMGTLWDENNPDASDKNTEFLKTASRAINQVLYPFYPPSDAPFPDNIKIRFPFSEEKWTKVEAVSWALKSVPFAKDNILKTTSCWHNAGAPCKRCKQCVKRFLALYMNGINEPGIDPIQTEEGKAIVHAYKKKFFQRFNEMNTDELNVVRMIQYYEGTE